MKALLITAALFLSQNALAGNANFLGTWAGTCEQSDSLSTKSQMEISFTETPKLTLGVWGIKLVTGVRQRYEGNNPAEFLFSGGGSTLSLDVKFDYERSPEIRWSMRRSGDNLVINTKQYHNDQFIPGTHWICTLAR